MIKKKATAVIVLLALSAFAAIAEQRQPDAATLLDLRPQESPQALATEYLAAFSSGNWRAVAQLSDSGDMVRLKTIWMRSWDVDPATVRTLLGLSPDESLEEFDAVELFARWLESIEPDDDNTYSMTGNHGVKVLGTVEEGKDVHVVYSTNVSLFDVPVSTTSVLTCRAHRGGWLATIPVDLEAVLFATVRRFDK